MELVVDANVLVASALRPAVTRELLLDERLTLWTPEHSLTETESVLIRPRVRKRLGELTPTQIKSLLSQVTANIRVAPASEYHQHMTTALQLAPHPEDAPYLALALHHHIPLWSNDAGLKEQTTVTVYTTHELLNCLS